MATTLVDTCRMCAGPMGEEATARMTLHDGTTYELDRAGYVLARSDGPRGWRYSHGWRILGFLRVPNAGWDRMVTLAEALDGADIGQGWVLDWDHGTNRMWASPSKHRAMMVRRHIASIVGEGRA